MNKLISELISATIQNYIITIMGNGSIIPDWIAHALGNIVSYSAIAFIL